ncbi:uncharacterized protein LOC141546082 [Sminthopsis crassicaudata]|uniref:uncharacterized protein LOC141546082 n=1 Tax=Sminthopsis crassicaudata TaxID=9301 RepID=UPI003D696E94
MDQAMKEQAPGGFRLSFFVTLGEKVTKLEKKMVLKFKKGGRMTFPELSRNPGIIKISEYSKKEATGATRCPGNGSVETRSHQNNPSHPKRKGHDLPIIYLECDKHQKKTAWVRAQAPTLRSGSPWAGLLSFLTFSFSSGENSPCITHLVGGCFEKACWKTSRAREGDGDLIQPSMSFARPGPDARARPFWAPCVEGRAGAGSPEGTERERRPAGKQPSGSAAQARPPCS